MKYLKNIETNQIVKGEEFGSFFDSWIELTQEELDVYELAKAKAIKIAQLKTNRTSEMEVETPKPSFLQIYEIDGVARTFKIKISDIAILNSRIIRLQNAVAGTTAQWTDIDNNRLDLTLDQFKTLANYLDVRDQNLFSIYTDKLAEINACTTLEELDAININF